MVGCTNSFDGGRNWAPLPRGLEVVEGFNAADMTFHDPHCMRICPSNPDRLYQQNHCGIYRIDRPSDEWVRIGRNMPARVGDIGFPMVVHPRDDRIVWVFPMDGRNVWPRTSPDGKPCIYRTRNAGKTWKRLDQGLPETQAWWTIKRQAMTADRYDPVGLYFGTTSGDLWISRDEGENWSSIARHLPRDLCRRNRPRRHSCGANREGVDLATPLRSYTGAREVDANGNLVGEILSELDRRYPGFRFRMIDEQDKVRPHIRMFVNGEQVFDLRHPLHRSDAIQIVQALSGG